MSEAPGSLSVVVPVYNEGSLIGETLKTVTAALDMSCWDTSEIIVVDDGSTDGTADALDSLALGRPLRVVRQENLGRFAARKAGIDLATGDFLLLLDSRVHISGHALLFLCESLADDSEAVIWNAHVDIEVKGYPLGRFWRAITFMAWRKYFRNPRRASFGLEEFDYFPKGTTCFFAPTDLLRQAYANFKTSFSDTRHANDDAPLIRWLAARKRIHIAPEFSCLYFPRDSLRKFWGHSLHRGKVFVDGYFKPGTRYFPFIWLFYLLTPLGFVLLLTFPAWTLIGMLMFCMLAALISLALGVRPGDAGLLAIVLPVFIAAYGAGMWMGLWMMIHARFRR
ncbi:MAG: glycosyltransferase family 2 protein [Actinobacteria bacterium]|nr:glycosyltransferase family 2 protein [Actinomycetota bacterium]